MEAKSAGKEFNRYRFINEGEEYTGIGRGETGGKRVQYSISEVFYRMVGVILPRTCPMRRVFLGDVQYVLHVYSTWSVYDIMVIR